MTEIEKTFLVKILPKDLKKYKSSKIKQGYISPSPSPLRVRQKDDKFEITKKIPLKPGDYSSCTEINIPLKEEEFKRLWPLAKVLLSKTRYYIPLGDNLTAELDVYDGDLTGYMMVEVEFPDKETMDSFVAPDWFGADVTQEEFSANSLLAGKTFEEVSKIIKQKYG